MDGATAVSALAFVFCLPLISQPLCSKEVQSWSLKSIAAHTDDPIDKFNQRSLYDGIIYDETYFDHLEFAIFEVAKDFNSLNETKLVSDRRKLYRGMHGMGRLISRAVDHDLETMKCVQVIGVQNMGKSGRSHYKSFSRLLISWCRVLISDSGWNSNIP